MRGSYTVLGVTRAPMEAVRNDRTDTWHLLGSRGCGVDPAGASFDEVREGTWAEIRDRVERDVGTKCRRCRWPRG